MLVVGLNEICRKTMLLGVVGQRSLLTHANKLSTDLVHPGRAVSDEEQLLLSHLVIHQSKT
jgi:hypothetical protein